MWCVCLCVVCVWCVCIVHIFERFEEWTSDHLTRYLLVAGVFIAQTDIGLGSVVGAAYFNVLFIMGLAGLLTSQVSLDLPGKYGLLVPLQMGPIPLLPLPWTIGPTIAWSQTIGPRTLVHGTNRLPFPARSPSKLIFYS